MVSVVGFLMVSGCYRTPAVSPMETVKKKHQDVSVTNSLSLSLSLSLSTYV